MRAHCVLPPQRIAVNKGFKHRESYTNAISISRIFVFGSPTVAARSEKPKKCRHPPIFFFCGRVPLGGGRLPRCRRARICTPMGQHL